jgi:hypothetical protein
MVICRYLGDGSLDTTFDGDGSAACYVNGQDHGYAVTTDSSGRILVAGASGGANETYMVLWCYQ